MMRPALAALLLLTLAACGKEAPPPPDQAGADGARGQVLEGTISDAMLPLDTIVQPEPLPGAALRDVKGDGEATPAREPRKPREQTAEDSTPEPTASATPESTPAATEDAD